MPIRSWGRDLSSLRASRAVLFDTYAEPFRWLESTWVDDDGTVYAWYHREIASCGPDISLAMPEIGALISYDGGVSFFDLGTVLRAGEPPNCEAPNGFFAGGHGDFTVILAEDRSYFYFVFSNYSGPVERQGVAIARMAFADRNEPVGAVWKYHESSWLQPGIDGVVTPMYPATRGWEESNTDAFWGPSIHYNTAIERYVVLMNRSCCEPGWPQEGVYIALIGDLANPDTYGVPAKLVESNVWYPQIIGLGPDGTDKRSGSRARLFIGAYSDSELVFEPTAEPTTLQTTRRARRLPSKR